MRLTTAGGAVGEDGSIVSVQYGVKEVLGGGFVYIALCDVFIEDSVEAEGLVFAALALRKD